MVTNVTTNQPLTLPTFAPSSTVTYNKNTTKRNRDRNKGEDNDTRTKASRSVIRGIVGARAGTEGGVRLASALAVALIRCSLPPAHHLPPPFMQKLRSNMYRGQSGMWS